MSVNGEPFPAPLPPGTLLALRPRRLAGGAWEFRLLFRPGGWTVAEVNEVLRRESAGGAEDGSGAWR